MARVKMKSNMYSEGARWNACERWLSSVVVQCSLNVICVDFILFNDSSVDESGGILVVQYFMSSLLLNLTFSSFSKTEYSSNSCIYIFCHQTFLSN